MWALVAVYAGARILQSFPDRVPMLAIVAAHVLPPAVFALLHGRLRYGLQGILVFFAVCLTVGNLSENLGILTGFPFGHYRFTDVMGPRVLQVPVLLGLAYVGMGYLAWTLACIIVGTERSVLRVPIVASFLMVSWDLAAEPVWATVVRAWIWREGGPYFGVPLTNFAGWFLTVFVFYTVFALYLRNRKITVAPLPLSYWRLAVLFYAISALGNLLIVPRTGLAVVADASGAQWRVADILAVSALVSVFTMGAFSVLSWIRLSDILAVVSERAAPRAN